MALAVVALGVGVQAIRPSLGKPAGPQVEVAVPPQVKAILVRRCYACHSDEPQLVWWDQRGAGVLGGVVGREEGAGGAELF